MAAIRFMFRGEELVIPENRAFAAGEAVEEVVTLTELGTWGKNTKFFKLSRAFAALAGVAGCSVTPQEVHAELMQSMAQFASDKALAEQDGGPAPDVQELFVLAAVRQLQEVLIQAVPEVKPGKGAPEGKPAAVS